MQDLYFDHILISNANKRQWWMPQLYDNREEILNRIQYSSFLLLKKQIIAIVQKQFCLFSSLIDNC